jgi:hypothetical protein
MIRSSSTLQTLKSELRERAQLSKYSRQALGLFPIGLKVFACICRKFLMPASTRASFFIQQNSADDETCVEEDMLPGLAQAPVRQQYCHVFLLTDSVASEVHSAASPLQQLTDYRQGDILLELAELRKGQNRVQVLQEIRR